MRVDVIEQRTPSTIQSLSSVRLNNWRMRWPFQNWIFNMHCFLFFVNCPMNNRGYFLINCITMQSDISTVLTCHLFELTQIFVVRSQMAYSFFESCKRNSTIKIHNRLKLWAVWGTLNLRGIFVLFELSIVLDFYMTI